MHCVGFDAIAAPDARVLILGSLPSVVSLERAQYYAHSRNSFWWIMGKLVGAGPDLAYEDRTLQLTKSGIALWDVCHSAERAGSSDAKIQLKTLEANNFRTFFSTHPRIQLICFNGQPADKLFRSKVVPLLTEFCPVRHQVLDSTSPANARITREEKFFRWRACLAPFIAVDHSQFMGKEQRPSGL
jgi:hypoxanthine-DNA glycosylase